MEDVYVLKHVIEDFPEIYGIFTSYVEADTQRSMLKKYNPNVKYGELKIYQYTLNEVYTTKEPVEIK